LDCLGLSRYAAYFEAEEIDAVAVLLMTEEDIAELILPDKSVLIDALRHVSWSSVKHAPSASALSPELITVVQRILRLPDSDDKWTKLCDVFEQLSVKLGILESVYGGPLQRMVLEPNSGVTSRVVETLCFRVPIMMSLAREFAETKDLHVGQTLLNLLVLYLRNCETAILLYNTMLGENARFAATVADIERDNCASFPLEHLMLYPVYFAVALPRAVDAVVMAEGSSCAQALSRFAVLAASVEAESHATGRALRAQETVRAVERRIAGKAVIVAVGRRLLHEGALMVAKSKQLEKFYGFLFSDLLLLTTQNSDSLQFRVRESINMFDGLGGGGESVTLCLERVTDELGDFGARIRSVHSAGLGSDTGLKV
jgi:hypothetical protein